MRRRRLLLSLTIVVLTVLAAGGWTYQHLSGNITALPLLDGAAPEGAGHESADASGHTPLTILLIGSDARANAADCRLGGGCGHGSGHPQTGGANADVEMIVHLAADRSNATVLSIPRDTVTQLPACTDPVTQHVVPAHTGMINSALADGPGCQAAAVHQLTGIPIDHFAMVDFSGVVTMADAVGGVQVCVTGNVYDTYSHLKLAQGSHVLTGQAALEFVRSRHGFGDGSDLGRTYAQHLYLAQLIRTLKSARTLANPVAVYSLADAATKALTVDTGLDSIPRLIGLAADLDAVPADRTTFATMQTEPDPTDRNRLVVAPQAQALFRAVVDDVPLSRPTRTGGAAGPTPGPSESPTPATSASPSGPYGPSGPSVSAAERAALRVEVLNGSGAPGRATLLAHELRGAGFTHVVTGDAAAAAVTTLVYPPVDEGVARAVGQAVGLPASAVRADPRATRTTLTIGADFATGTRFPAPAAASPERLTDGAHAQTAGSTATCAPVSTLPTVEVDHRVMTPAQAYAYATAHGVPDSAS